MSHRVTRHVTLCNPKEHPKNPPRKTAFPRQPSPPQPLIPPGKTPSYEGVPVVGLEPTRPFEHKILSLLRWKHKSLKENILKGYLVAVSHLVSQFHFFHWRAKLPLVVHHHKCSASTARMAALGSHQADEYSSPSPVNLPKNKRMRALVPRMHSARVHPSRLAVFVKLPSNQSTNSRAYWLSNMRPLAMERKKASTPP